MNKSRFLTERQPAWQRFEHFLIAIEGSQFTHLSEREVSEFSELFRAICYDLATVRSREWGSELERYLNDLVVRGHTSFYGSQPRRKGAALKFLTETFPRLFRQNIAYFWVALSLFAVPFAAAWIVVERNADLASRVLPKATLSQLEEMYSEEAEEARKESHSMESAMAGFYVRNNIGIAFRCFAMGIFFGLGTAYILVYNGLVLGTVSGYVIAGGQGERFLSFVVSHGSFELTAIVISGAAGLVLGHSLVAPGNLPRRQALRRRGLVAVQLALGAGAMLAVAALIEAFWSPSSASPMAKYLVGGALWSIVCLYLAAAGRTKVSLKESVSG